MTKRDPDGGPRHYIGWTNVCVVVIIVLFIVVPVVLGWIVFKD